MNHVDSTLVSVSQDPFCAETKLGSLDSGITPTDRFYVRSHFADIPSLNPDTWKLEICGAINRPISFTLDEIKAMPSRETAITLECAGNSRSYLTPPAEGLSFGHGAVSTAMWKGVPLADVLKHANVQPGSNVVIFTGEDSGEEEEHGVPFQLDYSRSIPFDIDLLKNTILSYDMNGLPLTKSHGFPLRVVVPRWYAMSSVKWLKRIEISDKPFNGFFQKRRYVFINEGEERREAREPVTLIRVKSIVTSPSHGEIVQRGPFKITGYAWSGEAAVTRVELSTTGGRTWQDAALCESMGEHAWRPWVFQWSAEEPGHYVIKVRASDASGRTQPDSIPWNFRGYANNSVHTIAVEVPYTNDPNP